MKTVNFGIIGIGEISHRFVKGLTFVSGSCLYAVSSRNIERAQAYATQYSVKHVYGSYDDMLKDENIDAVYIATPNHLHYEHIMLCLKYHSMYYVKSPLL